jgi:hypothetical protein
MKRYCENCGKRLMKNSDEVFICSYENTYCKDCAEQTNFNCPECKGRLEKRPTRILTEIRVIPLDNLLRFN